jgi:hypothetical protein
MLLISRQAALFRFIDAKASDVVSLGFKPVVLGMITPLLAGMVSHRALWEAILGCRLRQG